MRIPAYLDPGSGSFFLQLLIGTVVGTLYAFKSSLLRLRRFFGRGKRGAFPKRGTPPLRK